MLNVMGKYLYFLFLLFLYPGILSCGPGESGNQPYKWEITFEDNFDSLDLSKWQRVYESGGRTNWANKDLQWYKDQNIIAENGILKITAKKESVYGKDVHGEKQFEFTSGLICSSNHFLQAYGKWEIKVKFPFRKGFWPAFWLVPKQNPTLPEIDIFEYYGINKNMMTSAHHWGIDYPNYSGLYEGKSEPFYYVNAKDTEGEYEDRWMVWIFECFPDKMIWKLDDKVVFESTQGIPTSPLYMIANVAVKDHEANDFWIDDTGSPYIMEIDYVRVFKMIPQ
ncbi:MAG: glycoside hydrolase family 16 protein [Ignavibacteriae bacterium]|nr:glycoside hydrolase family 16 protein [Ignavibacteriota bacterium]